MRIPLTLATAAAVIVLTAGCSSHPDAVAAATPKASADSAFPASTVAAYSAYVEATGGLPGPMPTILAASEAFCTGLRSGADPGALLATLQREQGWSRSDALYLAAMATDQDHALCPDQLDRYSTWTLTQIEATAARAGTAGTASPSK